MITKQTQNKVNELARVIADDYIQFGKVPEDLIEKYKHLKSELATLQVEDLKQNESGSKIRDQKLILIGFRGGWEHTLLSYNEFEKILSGEMFFIPGLEEKDEEYQYFYSLRNLSGFSIYFNLFKEVGKLVKIEESRDSIELILAKKRLIGKLELLEVNEEKRQLLDKTIKTLKEEGDEDEN